MNMNNSSDFAMSKLVLDKIRVGVEVHLNKESLQANRADVACYFEAMTNQLAYSYRDYVLGFRNRPIQVELPLAPQQLLWQKYAPKWLQRKFPIKKATYTIDAQVIFPYFKDPVPASLGPRVVIYNGQAPNVAYR